MPKSQNQKVLDYISDNGSIDCARAVNDLRVYRLSARIKNLRDAGFPIITVMRENRLDDGSYKRWAEYYIDSTA